MNHGEGMLRTSVEKFLMSDVVKLDLLIYILRDSSFSLQNIIYDIIEFLDFILNISESMNCESS